MRAALRKEELIKLVPLSFYAIDKLEKDGDFPKRFSLTPRVVAWNRDEVEAWLDARQQNPDLIERDAGMMKGLEKTWEIHRQKFAANRQRAMCQPEGIVERKDETMSPGYRNFRFLPPCQTNSTFQPKRVWVNAIHTHRVNENQK